ncbi:MAG: class I SAM-dependent methyltransferase [Megasphaera sp.]|jgi:hypothetical protein|nr:class I SAM-dependent methyltransferase [Megasphaera sp.]MCH4187247.1 class I SAM-dependent methyltransferase [Megasphaera sp.]MCH4217213.1 class I SAM-dependent methyltransferase [Megasphaera sp.]
MSRNTIYVVPSLKAKAALLAEATAWSQAMGFIPVARRGRTTEQIRADYGDDFLIYTSRGPQIVRREGTYFFSLNMAELRIQHIRHGVTDHFIEALGASGAVRLLDCTCGFGADAIVASFALPQGSTVQAMEIAPLMAAVTSWGFSHFVHDHQDVTAALRRISLRCSDYRSYLQDANSSAYDILYFDPMFTRPVETSCQFQPVRELLDHGHLTAKNIEAARAKARKRVVIKGRDFRELVKAFPETRLYGGKYSRIGYAVLECDT